MQAITAQSDLRALFGWPADNVLKKTLPRLDKHCRRFISLSPFLLLSTQGKHGADVSPRGDPKGFVAAPDDATLLIPERPGNNRIDTLENILKNARVGIIFLVPGCTETLRVNGTGSIVVGAELEGLAQGGRVPKCAIRVDIEEAFFHCGKALIRARLWDESTKIAKSDFPPLGQVIADQIAGVDAEEAIQMVERAYVETLY